MSDFAPSGSNFADSEDAADQDYTDENLLQRTSDQQSTHSIKADSPQSCVQSWNDSDVSTSWKIKMSNNIALSKKTLENYSTCFLFHTDKAREMLTGLTIAECTPAQDRELYNIIPKKKIKAESVATVAALKVSSKMACSVCSTVFTTRNEQIQHYKLDWHRFNLKQKLAGKLPVSEDTFDTVADDISSLSASDLESDYEDSERDYTDTSGSEALSSPVRRPRPSGIPTRIRFKKLHHQAPSVTSSDTEGDDTDGSERSSPSKARFEPKVYLKNKENQVIALYRSVLHGKLAVPHCQKDLVSLASQLPSQMKWLIILVGGGHFAAAVFNGTEVVCHKTFHRYTVRAKQGGSQGSKDSRQGIQPKSAGASLRRHNEMAIIQDIQTLLNSWSDELQTCDRIFYRAPSFNRVTLFGNKNPPFKKNDPRLRTIPFPTRRATFSEVQRIHRILATLECFGMEKDFVDTSVIPRSPKFHISPSKPKKVPQPCTGTSSNTSCKPVDNSSDIGIVIENQSKTEDDDQAILKITSNTLNDDIWSDPPNTLALDLEDTVLTITEEINDTTQLKEFDGTYKPRRNRHKKGKKKDNGFSKRQQDPHSEALGEEKFCMRNTLYLACKTGDLTELTSILHVLKKNTETVEKLTCGETITKFEDSQVNPERVSQTQSFHVNSPLKRSTRSRHSSGGSVMDEEMRNKAKDLNPFSVFHERICVKKISVSDSEVPLSPKSRFHRRRSHSRSFSGSESDSTPPVNLTILNEPISDTGSTLLHVAAKEGQREIVRLLMENGADPSTKDKYGKTPYLMAKDKETRNEFRRFMGNFPEKYNYDMSQIPSPLNEEIEREKLAKLTEKKKEKRKARKEKIKEKKVAETRQKAEEEEKQRFLSLSDREKRAIAAEKRISEHLASVGQPPPAFSRCFQCGVDISGKVPFEYNNCLFCSTSCVKTHRKKCSS
ncbi:ankyrin repeat and zinc finger domain-containing protein 1-like isoform X2 [Limulus polyphemus]|uniref:Ankyrin repeat and zinc finger domain-containing protein 1-like isoform X2 n=1 Tax=Limulus polyphemus TaxID=6850 RepID=A0ABM1S4R4_LIMPO|nr:ankyrin repeat and zinc finger domain-containing protein 1-like isoform X2 [Limulus polyphemus]